MALKDDLRSVFKNQLQTAAPHAGPIVNQAQHIPATCAVAGRLLVPA